MTRKVLLAGIVMLLAAFAASSAVFYCPELPPDCCIVVFSNGCRLCAQGGC
jgi:hypothetical protein